MITPDYLPEGQCWNRKSFDPKGIGIHFISAKRDFPNDPYNYSHIINILEKGRFSAHEGILRNGDVKLWVPIDARAWHAGISKFKGETNLNKTFIGIEVFGMYNDDFTEEQYHSLAARCVLHMQNYGISPSMIKGHEQISGPKVRSDYKVDPGPRFNWVYFGMLIERLNSGLNLGA